MRKKEMIAMLLAGGQGSRLGVLTSKKAKPAVRFGGKYRIVDFPMSNCVNSGVDTVGVLTQYQPLLLNRHIGIGIPWDLDRRSGGVLTLAPHVKGDQGEWYTGSADAVYQNLEYIRSYNPDYVLVLSGDQIYKMDYARMLEFHKKKNCDVTIAALEVDMAEASRFGIINTEADDRIYEFEEKPAQPKSNLANMNIYIFNWRLLEEALIESSQIHPDSDFGKHVIPAMLRAGLTMYVYRFHEYWMDVGTIESYWASNMELIKTVPDFNLYDDYWKTYTDADHQPPQYLGPRANVQRSIVSEGCEVYGTVINSVLGPEVAVGEGAVIRDSIIMSGSKIGDNVIIDRSIVDENAVVGDNAVLGHGEDVPNAEKPQIYNSGITVVGEDAVVPPNVVIGKNCVIYGVSTPAHYTDDRLESGGTVYIEDPEGVTA